MSFNAGDVVSTLSMDTHGYGSALDKAAADASRFSATTTTILQGATSRQQAILTAAGQQASATYSRTWRQFVAEHQHVYMKLEGLLGPAMKRMGEDWRKLKSGEMGAADLPGVRSVEEATAFRASRGQETESEIRRAMGAYIRSMRREAQTARVAEQVQRALFGEKATIEAVANDVARDQVRAARSAMGRQDWMAGWGQDNRQAKMLRLLMGGGAIGAIAMVANQAAASITRVGDAMVRLQSGEITMEAFRTEMLRAIPIAGELGYAIRQIWEIKDRIYIAQITEATRRQEEHIDAVTRLRAGIDSAAQSYDDFMAKFGAEMSGNDARKTEDAIRRQARSETAAVGQGMQSDIDKANEAIVKLRAGRQAKMDRLSGLPQWAKDVASGSRQAGPREYYSDDAWKQLLDAQSLPGEIRKAGDEIDGYSRQIADLTEKMKGLGTAADALAGKRMADVAGEKIKGWVDAAKSTWGGLMEFGSSFLSRGDERDKRKLEDSKKQRQDLEAAGRALEESLMTPQEKWDAQISNLNNKLLAGVISQETWDRGVADANKLLDGPEQKPNTSLSSFIRSGSADAARYQSELNMMVRGSEQGESKRQTRLQERTAKAAEELVRQQQDQKDVVDIS